MKREDFEFKRDLLVLQMKQMIRILEDENLTFPKEKSDYCFINSKTNIARKLLEIRLNSIDLLK